MRGRGVLLLAILLLVPFTGCIFFPDDGLEEIFGSERVYGFPGDRLLSDVLQVRLLDEQNPGEWTTSITWTTEEALLIEKEHPGPLGGGGETHPLPAPDFPSIEVRFDKAERLSNLTAKWTVEARNDPIAESRASAAEPFVFEPPHAGDYQVWATLERDDRTIAQTISPPGIRLSANWSVDSSVYPLRLEDTPPPDNYDEMRDVFQLQVQGGKPAVHLETEFRGEYDPAQHGTDVDLGLFGPSGEPYECIGVGGGAGRLPNPAAAEETIDWPYFAEPGTYSIHVGTLHQDCSGSTWYHNQGPVPYRLTVQLG